MGVTRQIVLVTPACPISGKGQKSLLSNGQMKKSCSRNWRPLIALCSSDRPFVVGGTDDVTFNWVGSEMLIAANAAADNADGAGRAVGSV